MLSDRSPYVSVEAVAAGVPSGSTIRIDMANVLGPIRTRCRRGSGDGLHREDHQGASRIRDLSLISTVDLSGGRPLLTREACVSQHGWEERLGCLGFPLEVRIGNDAPALNTPHLAGLVFLLRDAVGDHAPVCTGTGWAHEERLWG
jgi:hypothetical protein